LVVQKENRCRFRTEVSWSSPTARRCCSSATRAIPNIPSSRWSGNASRRIRPTATRRPTAPGRTFDASGGAGRSAYEETDFHQLEEDRFAAETAELLKKRALRNDFDSLIIVAPPRTLGELRKHYHKEVEKRLTGEIAKDLTGHPVSEIEKILQAA
jgi:protein required for attachment to host cells